MSLDNTLGTRSKISLQSRSLPKCVNNWVKTLQIPCDVLTSWEDLTLLNRDNFQSLQVLGVSLASAKDSAGLPTAVREFLFVFCLLFQKNLCLPLFF